MNRDKYFNLFDSHNDYISAKDNLKKPNISYCEDVGVLYNPWTWEDSYLVTEALEDGTITFVIGKNIPISDLTSISYSADNGETWTTVENTDNKAEALSIPVSVVTGDSVLWKGLGDRVSIGENTGNYSRFGTTGNINIKGNIMSLIYGDGYRGQVDLSDKSYCFSNLFMSTRIVSAENLYLPATTLEEFCYFKMFSSCSNLVTAPKVLPAMTVENSCYEEMFSGCTSLTTPPKLPATVLTGDNCYRSMFTNCTSLVDAPELPAMTLSLGCYGYMFSGCTSLVVSPRLPATVLEDDCYQSMFADCTGLIVAPKLPATTLAMLCYMEMFISCTSLVEAPKLPATTLAENCYESMFESCTSLVKAPDLPATVLEDYCYYSMFFECESLNYVKMMAISVDPELHLGDYWLEDTSATGTFVRNSAAMWSDNPNYGVVPQGWTVKTE